MRLQRPPRRVRSKKVVSYVFWGAVDRAQSQRVTARSVRRWSVAEGLVCVCSILWGDRSARAFVRGGKARGCRRVGGCGKERMRMRLHEDESSLPPHSPGCLSFLSEVLSLIDLAVADAGGARGDETGVMEASAGGLWD